ncbi:type III secretion system stator protein SctL [Methylobacterium oryzihabitans]|uniref:type III secretion system stator protein SctL n=1 Tax=Methylobacterium oryzihabitans TaxID=2499852 RepID=UPI001652A338|nr:type III secretion system stator protein SctL [Methylobacterium oryzihabitans]
MDGPYRLSELGYRLPAGAHVLAPEALAPVEAATGLLREAEARAAGIVASAQAAYDEERRRGYADGLAQARLDAVERLLRESAALDAGLRDLEGELGRLVASCLRKLVAGFDDHARAEAAVRAALRQMRRERRPELRVAPAQFPAFKAGIAAIAAEFPEIEFVDVVEDAGLVPPQVVVEGRIGRVEADLDAALDDVEALIRGAVAAGGRAGA